MAEPGTRYAEAATYTEQVGPHDTQGLEPNRDANINLSLDAATTHINNRCNREFYLQGTSDSPIIEVLPSFCGPETVIKDYQSLTRVEESSDLETWVDIDFQEVPQTRYGFPKSRIRFKRQPRQYIRCTGIFGWVDVPFDAQSCCVVVASYLRAEGRFALGTVSRSNIGENLTRGARDIIDNMLEEYVRRFV